MRRQAYTLIELLIAAAIFASVLLMAFIAVSTVNQIQRTSRTQRAFYGTAQSVWQTISLYGKYARPVPTTFTSQSPTVPVQATQCPLQTFGPVTVGPDPQTVTIAETYGAILNDRLGNAGRSVWFVVRDTVATTPTFRLFGFSAVNLPNTPSNTYRLIAQRYIVSGGSCQPDPAGPPTDLLANSNAVLTFDATNVTTYPFSYNIWLDSKPLTDNALTADHNAIIPGYPWLLGINLKFERTDVTMAQPLLVQSSITIRPYQSSVSP